MHELRKIFAERIASGLKRKSLTTCSRWACACRVMGGKSFPGPWTFKYHPWLKEMHDSKAEMNIGQKSAQMGYTETALNIAFYNIDVLGVDTLYVLPAQQPDASDFSSGRFDPALELSPHLSKLFSDVKNVGHKRAGNTNLYVRGSRSRSGLKSIPVGLIILDEVDEMDQENIPLALERTAGQLERQVWAISTPTVPDHGINKFYRTSTQEHFFFRCPCCSRMTELIFPECLKITADHFDDPLVKDSHYICKECKGVIDQKGKHTFLQDNEWVPNYSNRVARGFYISQLYSSTISPVDLALSYLRSEQDPTEEQEFFNSKLGLEHIVEGAGVLDEDIEKCISDYKIMSTAPDYGIMTMGIDVGRWLHYEIDAWIVPGNTDSIDLNVQCVCRVVKMGKCLDFEELDHLMRQFSIRAAVIDANPERRKAFEFASRMPGLIKMCFYGQGVQGKSIHIGKDTEPTITVDRTSWLDLSLGRFRSHGKRFTLPIDTPFEYKNHVKAPIRRYEKDRSNNPIGRYISTKEDHYAHARNYAELALPFALSMNSAYDMHGDIL